VQSVIAAAAENDNDCKDDYPGTVVVEEIAKAVIIHMFASGSYFADFVPLSIILCRKQKVVN
jgi:hypothetical protein